MRSQKYSYRNSVRHDFSPASSAAMAPPRRADAISGDAAKRYRAIHAPLLDRAHGATAWEPEETHTEETGVDVLGESFRFDTLPAGQTIPIIEGTTDASGKVAGVKSYTGHMDRMGPAVPVTLTYRYTVTKTPPARAAGAR